MAILHIEHPIRTSTRGPKPSDSSPRSVGKPGSGRTEYNAPLTASDMSSSTPNSTRSNQPNLSFNPSRRASGRNQPTPRRWPESP